MRNFFVGLILSYDNVKNLRIEETMKSKFFTEESLLIFDTENIKEDKNNPCKYSNTNLVNKAKNNKMIF